MENQMQQQYNNKYSVLITVCVGTILTGYVSSSINIALPNIMQVFGFTMDSVVWVSLAYMLPYGSTLPLMGKLGDQFGRKKMYLLGLAIFTAATLLVGMAWNSTVLILFRILQGLGAGLLFPNAMALVSDAFPAQERGQALGMWGALAAAGSTLGPTMGGYVIEYMNWRLLFYLIIPISLLGLAMGVAILRESETNAHAKIDYFGGILLIISLCCLLMGLNQGSDKGWTSFYIISLFLLSAITMIVFMILEAHIQHPLVEMSLFENNTFTMSNIVGFLSFLAMYGGMFLLPFFLRNILGYSAVKAGVSLLPLVGAMVLLAPLGGKLADRVGSKLPASMGMTIIAAALYSFHTMDARTAYPAIAMRLILMGVGLAFTMSPLSNGAMGTLPKDKVGVGSGVFNLFKNVGGSVGVAIMGTLLDTRQTFHESMISEYVREGSEAATQWISSLQAGFSVQGMSALQAKTAALSVISSMVVQQAAVAAFEDVFLVTALICALGIVPALFIQDSKRSAADPEHKENTTQIDMKTQISVEIS